MYRLTENHISSELSNRTTILDYKAGIYYGLDNVGAYIWEILQKSPADFDKLKTLILIKFEIDEQTCNVDLREILTELINAHLVEEI